LELEEKRQIRSGSQKTGTNMTPTDITGHNSTLVLHPGSSAVAVAVLWSSLRNQLRTHNNNSSCGAVTQPDEKLGYLGASDPPLCGRCISTLGERSAPVNIVRRRHRKRIFYQKTQTQRALLGFSGAPRHTKKAVKVNCRPPDYTARDGLHIADGVEPRFGPARRLASPCVAQPPGPRCTLLRPVS